MIAKLENWELTSSLQHDFEYQVSSVQDSCCSMIRFRIILPFIQWMFFLIPAPLGGWSRYNPMLPTTVNYL